MNFEREMFKPYIIRAYILSPLDDGTEEVLNEIKLKIVIKINR
jgi:hypothetical protein